MSSRSRLILSLLGCLGLPLACSDLPPVTAPAADLPELPDLPVTTLSLPDKEPAAALQQAIDDLPASGGILALPEGSYKLERSIALKSNVHMVGVEGKTLLKGLGQGSILKIQGCTDVTVSQLVLDGQNRDKLAQAILALDSERVGVFRCEIRNTGADANGIELQRNVHAAKLIGNYLHDIGNPGDKWGTAITLGWGSSDAVLTDNRIEETSRAGINAHNDCLNLMIARNDIRRVRGEGLGIELWNHCSGTVEDNQVSARISFDGATGVIQRNAINGTWNATPPRYGIEVVYGTDVKVLANHVTAAQMGLSLDKTNGCLFQGNVVEGGETGLQGYGANAPSKGNTLLDNTFKNGSGRAMMLNQNCDGWRLEGNLIDHYGKSGIYLYGSDDATLVRNTIRYTCLTADRPGEEAAIRWHSDRKTRLVLVGNTLSNNRTDFLEIPARFMPDLGR